MEIFHIIHFQNLLPFFSALLTSTRAIFINLFAVIVFDSTISPQVPTTYAHSDRSRYCHY